MFCSKCGAETFDNENFCLRCGARLKRIENDDTQDGYVNDQSYDRAYNDINIDDYSQSVSGGENGQKTGRGIAKTILAVLVICIVALSIAVVVISAGQSDVLGEGGLVSQAMGGQHNDATEPSGTPIAATEPSEETTQTTTTEPTTTTTAEITTTTTTTTAATTKTTKNTQEADRIRGLLVKKKWSTTLEGYNADITFNKDGTATVTAKIKVLGMTIKKSVDAEYSVTDDCKVVLKAEYEGKDYGISGTISYVSDKELLVERSNNAGRITLKAAK